MQVRIYRPAKNAMQSGRALLDHWVLEYELETPRRPEPLMGWVSSGDTNNQVQLHFPTREAAMEFAHKKGWTMDVEDEHPRKVEPRNYASYIVYRETKAVKE